MPEDKKTEATDIDVLNNGKKDTASKKIISVPASVSSSIIKPAFNNRAHPLVMAYIGDDRPDRGDSKAAIGVGKRVSEILNGEYVYVDDAMLKGHFQDTKNIKERLKLYLEKKGEPDIVIGTHLGQLLDVVSRPPLLTERSINESYSVRRCKEDLGLVSHHLTKELLEEEGKEFDRRYPDIKGPLVSVFLTDYCCSSKTVAKKLIEIGKTYPEITFFVCPSMRGRSSYKGMTKALKSLKIRGLRSLWTSFVNPDTGIKILGQNWKDSENEYNPYLGLLSRADHIVVLGQSKSIDSEALFTGKNIYKSSLCFNKALINEGYVQDFFGLKDEPFPTIEMPPLDVTGDVAESIASEYQDKMQFNR